MIVANPHLLRLSPLYRPNLTGYYLRVYVTLIYQLWRHGMIRIGARRTCSWYDKRWQFPLRGKTNAQFLTLVVG